MKTAKHILILLLLAACVEMTTAGAQTVQYIIISKSVDHAQTDDGVAVALPTNAWRFGGWIVGSDLSAAYPTGTNFVTAPTLPTPSDINFEYVVLDGEWALEGESGYHYNDQAALDAAFPNGSYSMTVGGYSGPVNLSGDAYANMPLMTFSAGTWAGGTLYLTPAEAAAGFTVTSNLFSGWANDGTYRIGMYSYGLATDVEASTFTANQLVLNVAGGLLQSGQAYGFDVEFNRIVGMNTTAFDSLLGSPDGIALYTMYSSASVQVVPESSTYAALLGLGALIGVIAWRRRCA